MSTDIRSMGDKRKRFNLKVATDSLRRFNMDFGADLTFGDFAAMAEKVVALGLAPAVEHREPFASRHSLDSLEHAVLLAFGEALGEIAPGQVGRLKTKAVDALATMKKEFHSSRTRCAGKLVKALWGEGSASAQAWGPALRSLAEKWASAWMIGLDDAEAVIDREIAAWSAPTDIDVAPRTVGNISSARVVFAALLEETFRNFPSVKPRQATRAIALLWLATGWYTFTDPDFNPRFSTETSEVVREVGAALRARRSSSRKS